MVIATKIPYKINNKDSSYAKSDSDMYLYFPYDNINTYYLIRLLMVNLIQTP